MMEVPQADAIVVNPTHYAVALKYDRESMNAPQVVAKDRWPFESEKWPIKMMFRYWKDPTSAGSLCRCGDWASNP